ncbi:uncharacterized protein PAN0_013d4687 [Moesziomyces antarcticus]|uniref:Related to Asparaginyl-tRNA synthetase n=2 Tax=Pseudozyma antarctica TaxID=84753 RepID=A0A5C3FSV9_PSEA2|nr:uncharacterized protein PAN0_013d4687 [Moesziomyces antarcticus]GAK66465.1 conserved hypothetical protein [Moesziomyces antarcticus]SPO47508.1 related to Asparaginyl-tRNA synthetase [Moesziomyces antarcticus]
MLTRASRWSRRAATSLASPIATAANPLPSTSYAVISLEPRSRTTTTPSTAAHRLLSSSAARSLPRQLPRRAAPEQQQYEHDHAEAVTPSNVSDELSGTDPAIPWFLQTETVDPPAEPQLEESTPELVDTAASNAFSYIPLQPKVEEPKAVAALKAHLVSGPSANLIARPSDEQDQLTPVTLIHPASLSRDPSADAYGDNDWIVVVQVKSSAAGSVRRVALDIGRFLKHLRPPAMEAELDLDAFLGPGPSAPRYHPTTPPSQSTQASASASTATPRPKGMSRIEHELGKSLPDWAVHRIALQKKFPDGWRPPKILSREAQEGIRLLHASDPDQFDVVELSQRFRVGVESIRRILRSKWAITGEARSRQDRRAAERASEREESELAEILRLQEAELVDEGESPQIEEDEMADEMPDDEEGIQPVRYEGLVMSAADASALGVTSRTKAGGKKGDGNWCLVDADWCMVHVMTEQARFNYDIEGIWRELEAGKHAKPKPWEQETAQAPSRPRTKRDVFGSSLKKNKPQRAVGRFGDERRLSTSARRKVEEVPESLARVMARAYESLQSGEDKVPVRVEGWLRSTRKQKAITFLEVTDGSLAGARSLQAVVRSHPDTAGLTVGTAVRLVGDLKRGRGSKPGQEVELDAHTVEMLARSDPTYPLATLTHKVEQAAYAASLAERRNPHLLGRLPRYAAVARTRDRVERGMAAYLATRDFVKIACPVLTASDCEGAGEVFQVVADADVRAQQPMQSFWSGKPAYLTVSSQLHLEAAGLGLGRVWTLNPAFRAERSATNRHLVEFWMAEVEMYFTGLDGILDVTEGMVKAAIRSALEGAEDMEALGDTQHRERLEQVVRDEWKRITFREALDILSRAPGGTFEVQPSEEGGLASEHEKYLAAQMGPVFVTHYPLAHKAFYMKRAAPLEAHLVECFDLLIPELGELVGGSVREHRSDVLADNLQQLGASADKLGWYTDELKRFGGAVEHAGFGMGVERLLAWITNTASVKDVVPFPRTKGQLRF